MKRILIATDGSPASVEAVDVGLELAAAEEADVTFVHVLPADDWIVAGRAGVVGSRPHEVEMDESETALREAAEAAERMNISYALERISGETVDVILGVAEASHADLIVLGSRGRGEIASALLGSVSRDVLRRSKRPVLIVRAALVPATA